MLTFAVVVARAGRRVPDALVERLRDPVWTAVPFTPANHLLWSNDEQTVWFGGWQDAPVEPAAGDHWHVDNDGLTAFAGHLWPRGSSWKRTDGWAVQLAAHLRSTPLIQEADDLGGVYAAVSVDRHGRGAVAADPLGSALVYVGEGRDVTVVSSRASVAAGLLAGEHGAAMPKRDVQGVGWLAYCGRSIGDETGYDSVTVMPVAALIDIDPAAGARVRRGSRPLWQRAADDTRSPSDRLVDARGDITAAIRNALASQGMVCRAGLTGGKDSRLVLALLLGEGLANDVEFETSGQPDLPDVVVASDLAASFGLNHRLNPGRTERWPWQQAFEAAVRADGHSDLSAREIAFRVTAWVSSGERSVREPHVGRPAARDQVLLSGLFGEALRMNFPAAAAFTSKQRVATLPNDLGFGTAGILRPEALAHYRAATHRLLFDDCEATESPQDVVDRFWFRNWQRRWFATANEIDSQNRRFPLYSAAGIRLAFAIGTENRHSEWIHYQLMSQACAPLVRAPFADGGWPAGADGGLVPSARHHEPAPPPPPRLADPVPIPRRSPKAWKRTAGRDRRAASEAEDLELMRRFVVDDPSNAVFEIVDPVATARALDGFDGLGNAPKRQLYGALTAAIWLGGSEIALPR